MKYTNNVILKMRLKLFHTFYFCLRVAPIHTVAGIANISSFDLVKRTSVPVIEGRAKTMSDYEIIMLLLQVMTVVIAFAGLIALIFYDSTSICGK